MKTISLFGALNIQKEKKPKHPHKNLLKTTATCTSKKPNANPWVPCSQEVNTAEYMHLKKPKCKPMGALQPVSAKKGTQQSGFLAHILLPARRLRNTIKEKKTMTRKLRVKS